MCRSSILVPVRCGCRMRSADASYAGSSCQVIELAAYSGLAAMEITSTAGISIGTSIGEIQRPLSIQEIAIGYSKETSS